MALGDLAMNSGEAFSQQYLTDVLKILESATHMSLTSPDQFEDDPDIADYLI